MYDFTIGLFESIVKHGLSWSTAAAVLFLILKQRAMKRKLKRYLPFMFKEEEVNPTYVTNQARIESKLDAIMRKEGIVWNGPEASKTVTATNSKTSSIFSWGVIQMKEYLKKLGKTKFQALLASLIVNGVSAYLFLSGTLDLDGQLNTWMPIINLTVGTVSTWVYILVEGGIDKAREESKQIIVEKEPANDNTVDFAQESAK